MLQHLEENTSWIVRAERCENKKDKYWAEPGDTVKMDARWEPERSSKVKI